MGSTSRKRAPTRLANICQFSSFAHCSLFFMHLTVSKIQVPVTPYKQDVVIFLTLSKLSNLCHHCALCQHCQHCQHFQNCQHFQHFQHFQPFQHFNSVRSVSTVC